MKKGKIAQYAVELLKNINNAALTVKNKLPIMIIYSLTILKTNQREIT